MPRQSLRLPLDPIFVLSQILGKFRVAFLIKGFPNMLELIAFKSSNSQVLCSPSVWFSISGVDRISDLNHLGPELWTMIGLHPWRSQVSQDSTP